MTLPNKIRRICIGVEPKNQFVYSVGGIFPLTVNKTRKEVVIENIEDSEKYFLIYVNTGGEVQLWKKIPKNEFTTVEFEID